MTPHADVSVIIPSNRGGPFLAEAVDSVRNQTTPVREIILVDDGSPEPGLSAVADQLGLRYVRQDAAGVSTARNRGAAVAEGRWIAFLDDDDVWFPTKIAEQVASLAAHPSAAACHSDLTIIDERGVEVQRVRAADGDRRTLLRHGDGVSINTIVFARESYLAIGGCDTSVRYAEDLDLILRLLQVADFTKVDRALVGYRRHAAQVTSSGKAGLAARLGVLRRLIARARRGGDDVSASLLRAQLREYLPRIAVTGADDLLTALWRRRPAEAAQAARWLFVNTRAAALPALVRATGRRIAWTAATAISGGRR